MTDNAAAAARKKYGLHSSRRTWKAKTSTCAPSYRCFIPAFCTQAVVGFPSATYGYDNRYEEDTQGARPDWQQAAITYLEHIFGTMGF